MEQHKVLPCPLRLPLQPPAAHVCCAVPSLTAPRPLQLLLPPAYCSPPRPARCCCPPQEEAQPDFCSGLVLQCFCSDVQRMLEAELLPRAADISASIAQMQQEIAETSHRAGGCSRAAAVMRVGDYWGY